MTQNQNQLQIRNIYSKSWENIWKHVSEKHLTNRNEVRDEIRRKINSGSACDYEIKTVFIPCSVQNA
jgi:hypothetical protein